MIAIPCPCCGEHNIQLPERAGSFEIECPNVGGHYAYVVITERGNIESVCKSRGCMITTAVCGADSREVVNAKKFRDQILVKSEIGRRILKEYYSVGPPLCMKLENNSALRGMFRFFLVKPLSVAGESLVSGRISLRALLSYPVGCLFLLALFASSKLRGRRLSDCMIALREAS